MNIKRNERDETIFLFLKGHPERIFDLVPANHQIGEPQPIFREIKEEEIQKWKQEFGGRK